MKRNTLPVAIPEKHWRFLVFDNGGETQDRYTVFFRSNGWHEWCEYFALDQFPTHPLGFSQYGEVTEHGMPLSRDKFRALCDAWIAEGQRKIRFRDLPDNVQDHIYARLA